MYKEKHSSRLGLKLFECESKKCSKKYTSSHRFGQIGGISRQHKDAHLRNEV